MPPKDSAPIDPGTVYFQAPEGLQPLIPLDEAPDTEAEDWATEWPKDNPCIKPTTDATFNAEMQIDPNVAEIFAAPDVAKAFTALGEACKRAAESLGKMVRAAADCVAAIARGMDIPALLKALEVQKALNEAPPRVRHLAQHGKKYRTRKKNINRALREYRRRLKRDRP